MFVNTDSKYIWKNGSYEKWNESYIHILSHTVHYGTGVFEGVRAYNTAEGAAIFRLEDHTKRLFDAAKQINIEIPYSEDELNKVQNQREALVKRGSFLGQSTKGFHKDPRKYGKLLKIKAGRRSKRLIGTPEDIVKSLHGVNKAMYGDTVSSVSKSLGSINRKTLKTMASPFRKINRLKKI